MATKIRKTKKEKRVARADRDAYKSDVEIAIARAAERKLIELGFSIEKSAELGAEIADEAARDIDDGITKITESIYTLLDQAEHIGLVAKKSAPAKRRAVAKKKKDKARSSVVIQRKPRTARAKPKDSAGKRVARSVLKTVKTGLTRLKHVQVMWAGRPAAGCNVMIGDAPSLTSARREVDCAQCLGQIDRGKIVSGAKGWQFAVPPMPKGARTKRAKTKTSALLQATEKKEKPTRTVVDTPETWGPDTDPDPRLPEMDFDQRTEST